MSIHIKTGDKWYTCASVHVNVSGTWHTCRQVYVKTGDAWHKCLLNTSTKTESLASPLTRLKDYTVNCTNVKKNSTIKVTGHWKTDLTEWNTGLGIGTKNATPTTGYKFQAEIDYKWYWFPKSTNKTYDADFTINFTATSTSATLYIRASAMTVTNCKVTYTQEGYFD